MSSKQTLEVIGTKTIHIRTSRNDTKHVIMVITIMVDGTLLPSTLIIKGKPYGRITKKEFPSGVYPATHFYKCQENAWVDKEVMIAWVNEALAPYVETSPDQVIPVLILDMYRCHMMSSLVQMIQELGWRVSTSQADALLSASLWMSALTRHLRIRCNGTGSIG